MLRGLGGARDLVEGRRKLLVATKLGNAEADLELKELNRSVKQHCPLLDGLVEIFGTSRADRNGQVATVTNFDIDSGAYVVELLEGARHDYKRVIHVKPKNLRRVRHR